MKSMFESATIKLTGWYLLILMTISLVFSCIIYTVSISELNTRLTFFESQIKQTNGSLDTDIPAFHKKQIDKANSNLFFALFYTNLVVLLLGGVASYLAARRTLKPIEEAHEAQSRFTSDASHELRTPLAIIKSELEVALRDSNLSKKEMHELLESNLEEVNRLSVLSTTLLQISRQEFDELKTTKLDLTSLVQKVAKTYGLSSQRLELKPATKSIIDGNESSIRELITILMDNAIRYSPDSSLITMAVTQTRSNVEFTITNAGEGISRGDIDHVFERFYRGNKARTTDQVAGFGLGLSLAKKICDLHGAEISIKSTPGKFTTATVIFRKAV